MAITLLLLFHIILYYIVLYIIIINGRLGLPYPRGLIILYIYIIIIYIIYYNYMIATSLPLHRGFVIDLYILYFYNIIYYNHIIATSRWASGSTRATWPTSPSRPCNIYIYILIILYFKII